MIDALTSTRRDLRLPLYVALGAMLGGGYAMFDAVSESRLRSGTLTGAMAGLHVFVDRLSPLLVGMLLGVCLHYLRLRARLASVETAARAKLQKVERDQAVWVLAAAILHELNNPLHAIGLLVDELAVGDDAERRDLIPRIRAQADRARAHLRTLRAMGTSGEPDLKTVGLDGIAAAVASDLGAAASADGLVVEARCEQAVSATADPTYVRLIVENLVNNALASLREGGGKSVTLRVSREDGRAVVRVGDDGPPIDPRIDASLFEPLRSSKTHGLGLGLPIARALARAMQGDLCLERADEKVFRLDLPCA